MKRKKRVRKNARRRVDTLPLAPHAWTLPPAWEASIHRVVFAAIHESLREKFIDAAAMQQRDKIANWLEQQALRERKAVRPPLLRAADVIRRGGYL